MTHVSPQTHEQRWNKAVDVVCSALRTVKMGQQQRLLAARDIVDALDRAGLMRLASMPKATEGRER